MTNLIQQIEQMRTRMNELATDESARVRSLADALAGADQKLLQAVRNVAAEHEARRAAILKELQMLATRMLMLPRPPAESVTLLESTAQPEPASATEPVPHKGDWRQAAANIREELAFHLKARASQAGK